LPPLPQAAPYVPPPQFSTGPAPLVPGAGTTGPAPLVPGAGTTGPAPLVPSAPSGEGGAPDRSMSVPPTRPSPAPREPGRGLPLSRRTLMIAGGGVVALIAIIAFAASGSGSSKKTSSATSLVDPSRIEIEQPKDDGVARAIERAHALIASE